MTEQKPLPSEVHKTYRSLTGFQRDCLYEIMHLTFSDGRPPYGLAVKEELSKYYNDGVNHGRLYPNLDELSEMGLIEKGEIDKRTNYYSITDLGKQCLVSRMNEIRGQLDG